MCVGGWQSRGYRYKESVGKLLPDFVDTRWFTQSDTAQHHAPYYPKEVEWLKEEAKKSDHPYLGKANQLVARDGGGLQPQAIFVRLFGAPIYKFIEGLQVDIVPKGNEKQPLRPIAHRLYSRVLELEAELEGIHASLTMGPALKAAVSYDPKTTQDKLVEELTKVALKVLRVVQKYKESQLDFYVQVGVLILWL